MPGQLPVLLRPARDCHDLLPTHSTDGYATVCHAVSFVLLWQVLRAAAVRQHAFGLKHLLSLWAISVFNAASDAFGDSLAIRSLRDAQQHTTCMLFDLSRCHRALQVSTAQSSGTTFLYVAFMLRNMTWH